MKINYTIYGLAATFLLGGSLFGKTGDTAEPQQTQNQEQIRSEIQNQLGPLADDLRQLRLRYREQVKVLLQERERLIRIYRLATEEEQAAIRKQIREHQATIAETHRRLRRELRDQIREIRHERRRQIETPGG